MSGKQEMRGRAKSIKIGYEDRCKGRGKWGRILSRNPFGKIRRGPRRE